MDLNASIISPQNSFSGCFNRIEYRELRWYFSYLASCAFIPKQTHSKSDKEYIYFNMTLEFSECSSDKIFAQIILGLLLE